MKKHLLILASWSMLFFGAQTFTSCDDEDDDKDSKTSVVAESIVGTWAYNASESKTTSEESYVYNYFDFDEITFNADNTFVGVEDSVKVNGKYTISGNAFKMEAVVDGMELTLEQGEEIEKGAVVGVDNFEYAATVKSYTAAVDGSKLTFTLDIEYVKTEDGKVTKTETNTVTSVYNKKK